MFRQLSIALLVVTASVQLATAQRHGGFARGGARGIGLHHGTRRFNQGFFPGSPYFYSDYGLAEPYEFDNSVQSDFQNNFQNDIESVPAQFIVVRPRSADDSPRGPRPRPLLIELQGDRYVRFGGAQATDRESSAHPDYEAPAIAEPPSSAAQRERAETHVAELPPAVLVYRDGHREEVSGYAIADGMIYVRGDDWQNGYWTKHIPLAALDPAATMQANQQRGLKFMLPSAPNVVIASF
jgi:hypothetical protein